MQYDAAVQGGQIAGQITELNKLIADFDALISGGASFSGEATVSDPVNGNTRLSFPALTAQESAALFAGAKAVFQLRVDALSTQLAGL